LSASVRIRSEELLSDFWGRLRKVSFDLMRRDGTVETQVREVYDRGNGAAVLPIDPERGTVLLVRQFRVPARLNGHDGYLIEACAGVMDDLDAEATIRKEAEEELGYRLGRVELVFQAFMSPGSVTERIAGFTAQYSPADRISQGGGATGEGEDIEVLELPLARALDMIASGDIVDAKTIMLLQHAQLANLATPTLAAGRSGRSPATRSRSRPRRRPGR
jgi:nudix-type nucleoside diphosphatase (YffH/AdpP family)